jgi:hypothetical protein
MGCNQTLEQASKLMEKVFHHDYEGEQRKFFKELRLHDMQENPQNYKEIECQECKETDIYNIVNAEFKREIVLKDAVYCCSCAVKLGWEPNILFHVPEKYLKDKRES